MSAPEEPVRRTEQFVVAGPSGVLRALLDLLEADPETAVTGVTRNERTDPERLVISIDPQRAAAMQAALGTLVVIEPDQPLIL